MVLRIKLRRDKPEGLTDWQGRALIIIARGTAPGNENIASAVASALIIQGNRFVCNGIRRLEKEIFYNMEDFKLVCENYERSLQLNFPMNL